MLSQHRSNHSSQRLFILRVRMVPGLYHETVLEKFSKGLLTHLRSAARKWLHLPHDVPKALFHSHTADGGLGIPELLVQVPLMRRARVNKLFDGCEENRDPVLAAVVRMSGSLKREREQWQSGVRCYSHQATSRTTRERATAAALHATVDGSGLSDTREVPAVSRWVWSVRYQRGPSSQSMGL